MDYRTARDEYGRLTKDQKDQVLDIVYNKTALHSGPEAEQIFIEAVETVLDKTAREGLNRFLGW